MTMQADTRCVKALTLNLSMPGNESEKSAYPALSNSPATASGMTLRRIAVVYPAAAARSPRGTRCSRSRRRRPWAGAPSWASHLLGHDPPLPQGSRSWRRTPTPSRGYRTRWPRSSCRSAASRNPTRGGSTGRATRLTPRGSAGSRPDSACSGRKANDPERRRAHPRERAAPPDRAARGVQEVQDSLKRLLGRVCKPRRGWYACSV